MAQNKLEACERNEPLHNTWGFSQLLEHLDVGIMVLDLEEKAIDYCNPAFSDVLQEGRLCTDFKRLHDFFIGALENQICFAEGACVSNQLTYKGRLLGYSVYQVASRYCCIFVRDITEKVRLESIAQAVNTMENIGFIFSGIRHEIGNPLNSLKMTLSVLKSNLATASPEMLGEYLERGLADIGRVEYLLKSLKTFSMYDNVELKDISLSEFMERFITLVERDFLSRGIRIVTDIPRHISQVRIDERALHQALLNVFGNAADALANQEEPTISVSAEARGGLVWLSVSDNGCGISPENMKYLFQPFNTSKVNGTGLGMVISRKLLAMMNSDISVSSRADCGTQVTIRLPFAAKSRRRN
ncbi:MAG: hypothetical protein C0622_13305 [Desulfuromonas sp.]|nr:MAG: hypothetical protein C0622_13305 [Desulfuromonas sp.]